MSLDLTKCNRVTDAGGLEHVARLSALTSLNLSHCTRITEGGLAHVGCLVSS